MTGWLPAAQKSILDATCVTRSEPGLSLAPANLSQIRAPIQLTAQRISTPPGRLNSSGHSILTAASEGSRNVHTIEIGTS